MRIWVLVILLGLCSIGHGWRRRNWGVGPRVDDMGRWSDDSFRGHRHGGRHGGRHGRRRGNWWNGPNVCMGVNEAMDDEDEIFDWFWGEMKSCKMTDTMYKCETKRIRPTGISTQTTVYQCCDGFTREPGMYGCIEDKPLPDLPSLLESLELQEFVKLLDAAQLTDVVRDNNVTIFAPSDEALKSIYPLMTEISPGLTLQNDFSGIVYLSHDINESLVDNTKNILLGHLTSELLTSSDLQHNQIIESASPGKSTIRYNSYIRPVTVQTANCMKLRVVDQKSQNGVVHVTDGLLRPVTSTLLELIQKDPQLSIMKTVLGRSSVASNLKAAGDITFLVPTDTAFKKYIALLNKISGDQECLDNVLKNHIIPNVVCSAVVGSETHTRNLLHNLVNLTRDADDKLYVNGVQIISYDVMATNGVLYIIDDVLIPDEALDVMHLVDKKGLFQFVSMVSMSGLMKTLTTMDNITLFVPSNEAIASLEAMLNINSSSNNETLQEVLKYHVVPSRLDCKELSVSQDLDSLLGDKLTVRNYYLPHYPFGSTRLQTVQCAEVNLTPIEGCNGVAYVVDKVFLPPNGNVLDVIARDSRFKTLVGLLKDSKLADSLQGKGPFTVFAPTDKAFENLGTDGLDELKSKPELLKETLLNHVVNYGVCCTVIKSSTDTVRMRAMSDNVIKATINKQGKLTVGPSVITHCDLSATNGVVHVIDDVIVQSHDNWWNDLTHDWFWKK